MANQEFIQNYYESIPMMKILIPFSLSTRSKILFSIRTTVRKNTITTVFMPIPGK